MSFFLSQSNEQLHDYRKLLQIMWSLSKLFSENPIPILNYRITENIFCRSFKAENLSRKDNAYDAKFDWLGIWIKTFISAKGQSTEKIAEFNKLSKNFKDKDPKDLAYLLADYRNERIEIANNLYGITESLYHCIARAEGSLHVFEAPYNKINKDNIRNIKETKSGISFQEWKDIYQFNTSKSTLYKQFVTPANAFKIEVGILEDPYELLSRLFEEEKLWAFADVNEWNQYVLLPLYSTKQSNKDKKVVAEKSGLNQWNAGGRARASGELYIPVPAHIHKENSNFFPDRDTIFLLETPTGEILSAKMCQENRKALMTNPNNALEGWLLRGILGLEEKELLTYDKLLKAGFDSLKITKIKEGRYKVDVAYSDISEEEDLNEDENI